MDDEEDLAAQATCYRRASEWDRPCEGLRRLSRGVLESQTNVIQVVALELQLVGPAFAHFQRRNVGSSTSTGLGPSGLDESLPFK